MKAHTTFIDRTEGKNLLGRPRCMLKGTTYTNMNEIGCEGVDLMHLTNDRVHWFVPYKCKFIG